MLRGLKSTTWLKGQIKSSGRDTSPFRKAAERSVEHGDYPEAIRQLEKAIVDADGYGLISPRVILRIDLADVQRVGAHHPGRKPNRDQLMAALATAHSAIDLAAEATAAPLYVLGLDALAEILIDFEDFEALVPVAEGALSVAEPLPDNDPALMAQRTLRLALAWTRVGREEPAAELIVKAIEMQVHAQGEQSSSTGELLTQAASIYRAQGAYEAAEEVVRTAIGIHEQAAKDSIEELLADYVELAQILFSAGNPHGAITYFERALTMQRKLVSGGGPALIEETNRAKLVEMLYEAAHLQIRCGEFGKAGSLVRECIAVVQRGGAGEGGPARLANCYECLASIEESCGRIDTAVEELEHAAAAWERAGEGYEQNLIEVLDSCAALQSRLLRSRDAARSRERIALVEQAVAEREGKSAAGTQKSQPAEPATPPSSVTVR